MPNITFLSLIVFELEQKTCFRLTENGLGMAWNFGKKKSALCTPYRALYFCQVSNLLPIILTDSLKIKENLQKIAFFRP